MNKKKFILETRQIVKNSYLLEASSEEDALKNFNFLEDPITSDILEETFLEIYEKD